MPQGKTQITSHPDAPTMVEATALGTVSAAAQLPTPSFSPGGKSESISDVSQTKSPPKFMGNFEMHEAAYRSADKLEARSGHSLESLNSNNMKCVRTSCGTAMCTYVDDRREHETRPGSIQLWPAFGMSDTLLPGERCYALRNENARELFGIKDDSTFDPNDRLFLCGKNKPSAMMAPAGLDKQLTSYYEIYRGYSTRIP